MFRLLGVQSFLSPLPLVSLLLSGGGGGLEVGEGGIELRRGLLFLSADLFRSRHDGLAGIELQMRCREGRDQLTLLVPDSHGTLRTQRSESQRRWH